MLSRRGGPAYSAFFSLNSLMRERKERLGKRMVLGSSSPLKGEVVLPRANQSSMAARSYLRGEVVWGL